MVAKRKQENVRLSHPLSKKINDRSIPHVSRITKTVRHRRRHYSLRRGHHNSSKNQVRVTSIVHRSLRSPTKAKHLIAREDNMLASQVNEWDNEKSNEHLQSNNISMSTHPEGNHPRSLISKYPFKSNKVAHSEISKPLNRTGVKNEHPTVLDETKKEMKRKCFNKKIFCSLPCLLLSLLLGLLIAGVIAGTIVGVLTKSKTTTTSIILTTTTISTTICSCLCATESWTFSSDLLARWSFDGTFADVMNTYNATSMNYPSFVTNGYVNQALFFNATFIQSLSTPYIPLSNTSFTIEAWLKPTLFPNLIDHSILGLCPSASSHQCLYVLIRRISSNPYLYFGFFGDDCQGNTSLSLNQWIHVAFVFDLTTLIQSIYLNGRLDNSCTASSPFMGSTGSVTIGTVPAIVGTNNTNFYQGYMDHISITKRAKSSCEVLEDATLAACFLFDTPTSYTDSGPNSLSSSQMSTAIVSSGYSHEAISFNGTAYFQASSFTGLGMSNRPFSILLWIRPRSVNVTIVHVSNNANGIGWCLPFMGIAANGSFVAQVFNGGVVPRVTSRSIPMSPVWSHIVETWSPTNGLRLYINNLLEASLTSSTSYTASGVSNFVTLANSLASINNCLGGGLGARAPRPYDGDIDGFRLYSRELTASDVSTIYGSQ